MSRITFSADDIAAAFGQKPPSTRCAGCGHARGMWHDRQVVRPGGGERSEVFGKCDKPDRRRASGECPCEKFVEPEAADGGSR